jgi:hypothetical protein
MIEYNNIIKSKVKKLSIVIIFVLMVKQLQGVTFYKTYNVLEHIKTIDNYRVKLRRSKNIKKKFNLLCAIESNIKLLRKYNQYSKHVDWIQLDNLTKKNYRQKVAMESRIFYNK